MKDISVFFYGREGVLETGVETSAPMGADKCNFPPFYEAIEQRPTKRMNNQPSERPTDILNDS